MNVASGLEYLGFEAGKDFVCIDLSDGNGPYLAEWYSDQPRPSDAAIAEAVTAYERQWETNDYQRQRAVTYWPLADQLDAIYWDKQNGTNVWEQHIEAVKNTFPKP